MVWEETVRRSVIMRLENVFRFPTNTVSPSMKYAYNVCSAVNRKYTINPAITPGFDFSNSTFHPYKPVNNATPTPAQPSASRTSVCKCCCLNKSGLDKKRFRASSQACLRSVTFALLTLMTSRSSSAMVMLSGPGGGGCRLSVDWDRDGGRVESVAAAGVGDEPWFGPPLAACFRVRGIVFFSGGLGWIRPPYEMQR